MREALLLTMMDPPEGGDAEFNDWANTEHLPERRLVTGIRTALRFRNTGASPRYMAIYDLEDISVLQSPAYAAIAGENLSPWSKRILAAASSRWRFEGTRIDAGLPGQRTCTSARLAELLLITWRVLHEDSDDAIVEALDATLDGTPGILQRRVFRGRTNGHADYVGLVESEHAFDGIANPLHFSRGPLRCDRAQRFLPIETRPA